MMAGTTYQRVHKYTTLDVGATQYSPTNVAGTLIVETGVLFLGDAGYDPPSLDTVLNKIVVGEETDQLLPSLNGTWADGQGGFPYCDQQLTLPELKGVEQKPGPDLRGCIHLVSYECHSIFVPVC